ncbi:hypothetical protein BDN72DRAFT_339091 [Pluteus cervinus]|uniref:Uncharacterized protein n=1 Tax=Pluteus cervinus TaxID=181527 RepID=A0ACD3ABV1_9AGAR|nr:hypothetical protein BDN72DRAFT_339091 [Pluteus cervinus]
MVKTKVMEDPRFGEYFPLDRREQDGKVLGKHIRKQARWMRTSKREAAEEKGAKKRAREEQEDDSVVNSKKLKLIPDGPARLIREQPTLNKPKSLHVKHREKLDFTGPRHPEPASISRTGSPGACNGGSSTGRDGGLESRDRKQVVTPRRKRFLSLVESIPITDSNLHRPDEDN